MNTIAFAAGEKESIHMLSLGTDLSHFIHFDFDPFYTKCLDFTENALRIRFYDEADALLIKDLIRACHPLVTACYTGVFESIVLDCMIDIICRTKGLSLEALWAQNISSDDSLGVALFSRISEYKACRAVNQWVNLQRMQNYARKKVSYVFAQQQTTLSDCKVRAMYFDLAFITAAKKCGVDVSGLTTAGISSPALLPSAPKLMSPVTMILEPVVSQLVTALPDSLPHFMGDCYKEQMSSMLCTDLLNLPLPDGLEMISMLEKLRRLPSRVYTVSGLKQMIDLEIDELLSCGLMLCPSEETGRLELASIERRSEETTLKITTPVTVHDEGSVIVPATPDLPAKKSPSKARAAKKPDTSDKLPTKAEEPKPVKEKKPKLEKPSGKSSANAEEKKTQKEQSDVLKTEADEKPKSSKRKSSSQSSTETREPLKKQHPAPPSDEKPVPAELAEMKTEKPSNPRQTKQVDSVPKASEPSLPSEMPPQSSETSATIKMPDSVEGRMSLLLDLASDKNSLLPSTYKSVDMDVLCQSVHTELKSVLKDERDLPEVGIWSKHLFRIRGGILAKRFSADYLLRFLDATVKLYKLKPSIGKN